MNLKKKFVIGAASVALVAGMGGVAAPAAVADTSLPGSIMKLERLGGLDRVQTSLKVAKAEFGTKAPERLYVVSAAEGNMVDAATAGMLTDGPIVFVYNNSYVATAVGKDVAANIAGIKEVVAIGGDGVISDSTLNAVKDAMKVKKTSRLAGKDRYATSVAIADYLYTQSIKGDKSFANRTSGSGNFLNNAYLANGANEHVVDSMVAGTLDDGAILLVQPDGKIPEVVAEFIKKALPTQFSALGGTGAVSDATVNEAWVIKALGNKWETSYSIPNLREKIDELNFLIDGVKDQTGTNLSDKATFGGLKHVVDVAESNYASWANKVANEKQEISNHIVSNPGEEVDTAYTAVKGNLTKLYGSAIADTLKDAKYFELNGEKKVKAVNYDAIEAKSEYKKLVEDATKQLDKVWADEKHQGEITDDVAKASQMHTTAATTVTEKFAAIAEVAKYTVDNDKKWLDTVEKQRASLKAEWRTEFDKIAPKTVQRFGGKDRFETAQLIANWFSKYHMVEAAYVANGTRLADSLAAGQLTGGPILLVRNDTKIPEFTANVATHLLCWNGKPIKVSAIGGEGVVSDDVLSTMVNLIGTKSVCKVKTTTPAAPAATASAKPVCNATLAKAAGGAYSVTCTTPNPVPAGATLTYKWEKVTDADNSITGLSNDTASNGNVTGESNDGDKIKVTVTYDEDGAGTAKTPTSEVFEATAA
nr:cell wall-binding repeat-containing protein [Mobiluncus sp. Marseille-Q7826]